MQLVRATLVPRAQGDHLKKRPLLEAAFLTGYYWKREVIDEPVLGAILCAQFILFGLLVGFVTFQNASDNNTAQRIIFNFSRLMTTIVSMPFLTGYLVSDRVLVNHGLYGAVTVHSSIVFLTKWMLRFLCRAFLLTLYGVIAYPLSGLVGSFFTHGLLFIAILWLHEFAATSLGFFFAVTIVNTRISDALMVVFIVCNVLFSGISIKMYRINAILSWIRFLCPTYYSGQAMIANQNLGVTEPSSLEHTLWFSLTMLATMGIVFLAASLVVFAAQHRYLDRRQ